MATPASQLDIVTVMTAVAVSLFGSEPLAGFVGPYFVIILCAVLGASLSGSGHPTPTRAEVITHLARAMGLAVVATVPLSLVAEHDLHFEARWLFGPVALLVGWRNRALAADLGWAVGLAKRVAGRAWGGTKE